MSDPDLQHMRRQSRWPVVGGAPIAVGVLWLVSGWNNGIVAGLLSSLPGIVLTAAGGSLLLWPGDRHVNHWLTLSAAVSVVFGIAFAWIFGVLVALFLAAGGAGCVLLGGYMALRQDAVPAAVPTPRITLSLAAKAALDEGMLAFFTACASIPRGTAVARDHKALQRLQTLTDCHGWADAPERLLGPPRVPEQVDIERVAASGRTFDWIAFDSGYEPPQDLPGAPHWLEHQANRQVHARVFCHADTPRPWLMCIHGYQMGGPGVDFTLFGIDHLHHELGLNLIMPILPLHGARRVSRVSGGQFLDGSLVHMFHAEAQALQDLRCCLAWLRTAREAERIGVLGYSLGGYNAALLAAFEPALACVIAGIPLTDIPAVLWRQLPLADLRYFEARGLRREWLSQLMAPLSPLHLTPRVPRDRRYIFAATGDQLVPPAQPLALWRHWDEPAMHWYQGTHLSARREAGVAAFVDRALSASGLAALDHRVVTA